MKQELTEKITNSVTQIISENIAQTVDLKKTINAFKEREEVLRKLLVLAIEDLAGDRYPSGRLVLVPLEKIVEIFIKVDKETREQKAQECIPPEKEETEYIEGW